MIDLYHVISQGYGHVNIDFTPVYRKQIKTINLPHVEWIASDYAQNTYEG